MIKPNYSLGVFLISLLIIGTLGSCKRQKYVGESKGGPFSFGVIADCQYCQIEGTGVRKYAQSDSKLKACVSHLNTLDLAYTIHLGDFIDRDWESFDVVGPIYQQLKQPALHVLGNHDFSVADSLKDQVRERMNMPADYYDFKIDNWRFVVLNGNDLSFYAYPEASPQYNLTAEYYEKHQIDSPKWNGGIGDEQLKWLEKVLIQASRKKEKVALFCHFPVYPPNIHNLWNAAEIIALLERYPVVKAYINGHNHAGNYAQKSGIHYLTMQGMVDTEETSYAVISLAGDSLLVNGFGREESRVLSTTKAATDN